MIKCSEESGICDNEFLFLLSKNSQHNVLSGYHTAISAGKKDDEEDDDLFDDDEEVNDDEEEEENPFDREPTDKDIIEDDLPIDPAEDLFDDDEEVPYN